MTVWDLFTVDDVVYPIAVFKNKMAKWVRENTLTRPNGPRRLKNG